jgi:hypothetical protein
LLLQDLYIIRPLYYKILIIFKSSKDNKDKTTILDLGIIIYKDLERVAAIYTLVKKYKDVWTNKDIINILEKD